MKLNELEPLLSAEDLKKMLESEQIEKYYEIYLKDFVKTPLTLGGKKIKIIAVNSKLTEFKKYHETFAHIVTREYKSQNDRFFDIERANRIHWIKPILLSYPDKEILYFKWEDERGLCKQYFWFFKGNFMVILKEISKDLQIVTAFCVDTDEMLKYYEWHDNYKNGKGKCK